MLSTLLSLPRHALLAIAPHLTYNSLQRLVWRVAEDDEPLCLQLRTFLSPVLMAQEFAHRRMCETFPVTDRMGSVVARSGASKTSSRCVTGRVADDTMLLDVFSHRHTFTSVAVASALERSTAEPSAAQRLGPKPASTLRADLCMHGLAPVLHDNPDDMEFGDPELDRRGVYAPPADGTPAVVDRDGFLHHWAEFTKNQLAGMAEADWENVVAAGGAVCACMLPVPDSFSSMPLSEYYHDLAYRNSDVDLFLYGLTAEEVCVCGCVCVAVRVAVRVWLCVCGCVCVAVWLCGCFCVLYVCCAWHCAVLTHACCCRCELRRCGRWSGLWRL